jgi:hypothetical protein
MNRKQNHAATTQPVTSSSDSLPHLPANVSVAVDAYKEKAELLLLVKQGRTMYSVAETAESIGVSEDFIRRRINKGLIKTVAYGDRRMISIEELARIHVDGIPS